MQNWQTKFCVRKIFALSQFVLVMCENWENIVQGLYLCKNIIMILHLCFMSGKFEISLQFLSVK